MDKRKLIAPETYACCIAVAVTAAFFFNRGRENFIREAVVTTVIAAIITPLLAWFFAASARAVINMFTYYGKDGLARRREAYNKVKIFPQLLEIIPRTYKKLTAEQFDEMFGKMKAITAETELPLNIEGWLYFGASSDKIAGKRASCKYILSASKRLSRKAFKLKGSRWIYFEYLQRFPFILLRIARLLFALTGVTFAGLCVSAVCAWFAEKSNGADISVFAVVFDMFAGTGIRAEAAITTIIFAAGAVWGVINTVRYRHFLFIKER